MYHIHTLCTCMPSVILLVVHHLRITVDSMPAFPIMFQPSRTRTAAPRRTVLRSTEAIGSARLTSVLGQFHSLVPGGIELSERLQLPIGRRWRLAGSWCLVPESPSRGGRCLHGYFGQVQCTVYSTYLTYLSKYLYTRHLWQRAKSSQLRATRR